MESVSVYYAGSPAQSQTSPFPPIPICYNKYAKRNVLKSFFRFDTLPTTDSMYVHTYAVR